MHRDVFGQDESSGGWLPPACTQVPQKPNWMMFDVLLRFLALFLIDLLGKASDDVLRTYSRAD